MVGEFYSKKKALRDAFNAFYEKHKTELDRIYDELANFAKEKGLYDKYRDAMTRALNAGESPIEALRKAAEELGVASAYRDTFRKLDRALRKELGKAYENIWSDKDREKMAKIASDKKLSEAYTLAMEGKFKEALEKAGAKIVAEGGTEKVMIGEDKYDMPTSYAQCLRLISRAAGLKDAYKDLWKPSGA